MTKVDPETRFWAKVDKSGDCWEWKGDRHNRGYGRFYFEGYKYYLAHRWIYEQLNGKLPVHIFVMHTCDNRKCVRPDHLIAGTNHDNVKDCVNKGRNSRGERNGNSRLTEQQVISIRKEYMTLKNFAAVGRKFGIGTKHTKSIVERKLWKYL